MLWCNVLRSASQHSAGADESSLQAPEDPLYGRCEFSHELFHSRRFLPLRGFEHPLGHIPQLSQLVRLCSHPSCPLLDDGYDLRRRDAEPFNVLLQACTAIYFGATMFELSVTQCFNATRVGNEHSRRGYQIILNATRTD